MTKIKFFLFGVCALSLTNANANTLQSQRLETASKTLAGELIDKLDSELNVKREAYIQQQIDKLPMPFKSQQRTLVEKQKPEDDKNQAKRKVDAFI
ncbi:MAG: hypothetical protein HRU19_15740 [Pseudobacteriovorax sp.]|nr:hypothetical protein [Pseudobacteriovorax sp.]